MLEGMKAASELLEAHKGPESSQWRKAACRSAFRLARYADSLYNSVVAQMQSAEWKTARNVIAHKQRQVAPRDLPE